MFQVKEHTELEIILSLHLHLGLDRRTADRLILAETVLLKGPGVLTDRDDWETWGEEPRTDVIHVIFPINAADEAQSVIDMLRPELVAMQGDHQPGCVGVVTEPHDWSFAHGTFYVNG